MDQHLAQARDPAWKPPRQLPVATPPNAIVFSSGLVSIPHMARAGFLLNIVAIAVLAMAALWLSPVVFGG